MTVEINQAIDKFYTVLFTDQYHLTILKIRRGDRGECSKLQQRARFISSLHNVQSFEEWPDKAD